MTDREVFVKFMGWMGLYPETEIITKEGIVIQYNESNKLEGCDTCFTKISDGCFYSGALFDMEGNIIKAFLDAHPAWESKNSVEITKLIKMYKQKNEYDEKI